MDLSPTIIPKSDQLNADDLVAGPITIKITSVDVKPGEQPVSIHYEGENGRPYKPSKGMRRVLVMLWGKDGKDYVGRRLTLFRNPDITFGKDKTGGIQISHASHIAERAECALTVRRGRREPFFVEPLVAEKTDESFDIQSLTDIGATKAREGMAALSSWFTALPKEAKKALKGTLDSEWKPLAEQADKQSASSTP